MESFVGLITLRKLCNHPDLVNGGPNKYGNYFFNLYLLNKKFLYFMLLLLFK